MPGGRGAPTGARRRCPSGPCFLRGPHPGLRPGSPARAAARRAGARTRPLRGLRQLAPRSPACGRSSPVGRPREPVRPSRCARARRTATPRNVAACAGVRADPSALGRSDRSCASSRSWPASAASSSHHPKLDPQSTKFIGPCPSRDRFCGPSLGARRHRRSGERIASSSTHRMRRPNARHSITGGIPIETAQQNRPSPSTISVDVTAERKRGRVRFRGPGEVHNDGQCVDPEETMFAS